MHFGEDFVVLVCLCLCYFFFFFAENNSLKWWISNWKNRSIAKQMQHIRAIRAFAVLELHSTKTNLLQLNLIIIHFNYEILFISSFLFLFLISAKSRWQKTVSFRKKKFLAWKKPLKSVFLWKKIRKRGKSVIVINV